MTFADWYQIGVLVLCLILTLISILRKDKHIVRVIVTILNALISDSTSKSLSQNDTRSKLISIRDELEKK